MRRGAWWLPAGLIAALGCALVGTWGCASESTRRIEAVRTAAERTEYADTSTHAEVVSALRRLAEASPLAHYASMGVSGQGREIPMLILADPPVHTAADARRRSEEVGTATLLVLGGIHAGECDGKEALVMLARELLARPAVLRRVVLVLAPLYNPDGNEKVGEGLRPGQHGPARTGTRENASGLDLNRDFVKVEAPETAALLGVIRAWDPHVVVDTHTTDGSFHRYLVTYAGPKNPAGDAGLIEWSRGEVFPELARRFERAGGSPAFWYGNFEGEFGGARGKARWETFPAEARYGTTYVGLRGRLGVLVESYSYAPFRERVRGSLDFVRGVVEWAGEHRRELRRRLDEVDRRTIEAGRRAAAGPGDEVAIASEPAARPGLVTLLGYEEEVRDGRVVPTARPASYNVEMWDDFRPTRRVTRPAGYTFASSAEGERLAAKLREHGVRVDVLGAPARLNVETYRVVSASHAPRPFQGRTPARLEVLGERGEWEASAGDFVVGTAQPLGNLAVYLLEPASEDGMATWNYFDASARAGEVWPVRRIIAPRR